MRIYCIFLGTFPRSVFYFTEKQFPVKQKRDSAPSFHPKQNPFSFTLFNFLYVLLYNHFQYNAYNRILNHFQRRFEDHCIYSYLFSH